MLHNRRIRLPDELRDFGLSHYGRDIRDRLAALGYRLGRHRWYWRVFKSYLGGEDVFIQEFGNLSTLSGWLVDQERYKTIEPQRSVKF